MNRNNYISPRSYGNEATLFINPAKKETPKVNKKNGKQLSFISSLIIVLVIAFSILGYSVFNISNLLFS